MFTHFYLSLLTNSCQNKSIPRKVSSAWGPRSPRKSPCLGPWQGPPRLLSAQTACMCQPLSSPGQQSRESLRDLPLIKAVLISCFGGSLPAPSSPWPEDQSGQGGHRVCVLSPGPHGPGSSATPEGRGCPQSAASHTPALSSLCASADFTLPWSERARLLPQWQGELPSFDSLALIAHPLWGI